MMPVTTMAQMPIAPAPMAPSRPAPAAMAPTAMASTALAAPAALWRIVSAPVVLPLLLLGAFIRAQAAAREFDRMNALTDDALFARNLTRPDLAARLHAAYF